MNLNKMFVLLVSILLVLNSCDDEPTEPSPEKKKTPVLTNITPDSAFVGEEIILLGSNLGERQDSGIVSFDGIEAKYFRSWDSTEIQVTVPENAKSGSVWVETINGISNKKDFVVKFKTPVITDIIPDSSYTTDHITIKGYNFGDSRGTSIVSFNGIEAKYFKTWDSTEIQVGVPENAQSGSLWVETINGISNSVDFIVRAKNTDCATIYDIDGTEYPVVKIGDQLWFQSNLNVTHYQNGDPIRKAQSDSDWIDANNKKEGAYCVHSKITENHIQYGKLYNFWAVIDQRGLAPENCHVASDDEWKELELFLGMHPAEVDDIDYRGSYEGNELLAKLQNNHGFSALEGGSRMHDSGKFCLLTSAYWWTSTECKQTDGWVRCINSSKIYRNGRVRGFGFNVRCIME